MKALTIHIRFFDGFTVTYPGQSSAREAMIYPSPTTLVGALAAARARRLGAPEVARLGKKRASYAASLLGMVKWAAPALLSSRAIAYRSTFRAFSIPYLRPTNRRLQMAFAATVMGRVAYDGEALLLYIVEEEGAEELAADAWGITAIGTKESLVEVLDVKVSSITRVPEGPMDTWFPIPCGCVSQQPLHGCRAEYIPLIPEAYTPSKRPLLEYWYVPCRAGAYGGLQRTKLPHLHSERCEALSFDTPLGRAAALIPRGAAEGRP